MTNSEVLYKDDPKAFVSWMYETYKNFVYSQAWQYQDQLMEVEDITQEVWINLLNKSEILRTYSKQQQLSYIATVVRNTAISINRKKHKEYPLEFAAKMFYNETEIINEILDRQMKTESFHRIWSQVPSPERELLERKYLMHESDAEIAGIFGIRANSVRMYISRARKVACAVLLKYKDDLL